MAEQTLVKLQSGKGEPVEFEIQHAQRILQYQDRNKRIKSDWELTPGQPYTYKDGTITATGSGKDSKAGK